METLRVRNARRYFALAEFERVLEQCRAPDDETDAATAVAALHPNPFAISLELQALVNLNRHEEALDKATVCMGIERGREGDLMKTMNYELLLTCMSLFARQGKLKEACSAFHQYRAHAAQIDLTPIQYQRLVQVYVCDVLVPLDARDSSGKRAKRAGASEWNQLLTRKSGKAFLMEEFSRPDFPLGEHGRHVLELSLKRAEERYGLREHETPDTTATRASSLATSADGASTLSSRIQCLLAPVVAVLSRQPFWPALNARAKSVRTLWCFSSARSRVRILATLSVLLLAVLVLLRRRLRAVPFNSR
ncbi:hypothetical protein FVE85_5580 [Porphyridium purpureum]|uniref:Uncharacterized protein n=1 Tax=Porphyridium purpureum TaxID=35688 RepID=A0A5J4Z3U7_PORPP|nr:hypothetical protein FVE85_5580 [Porphyridium purpureum]|eukprot:POR9085..scf295_1